MRLPRVAIVHPGLGQGGSEAAVLWAIETLKECSDVALTTSREVDFARVNDYYGTNIKAGEISVLRVPCRLDWETRRVD